LGRQFGPRFANGVFAVPDDTWASVDSHFDGATQLFVRRLKNSADATKSECPPSRGGRGESGQSLPARAARLLFAMAASRFGT
jgi:hypothetical protein